MPHRARIMKLLAQHVARNDFWPSTIMASGHNDGTHLRLHLVREDCKLSANACACLEQRKRVFCICLCARVDIKDKTSKQINA